MASDVKLQAAKDAADSGHYDKAWPIINQALFEEPDDPKFLTLASFIYEKQGHVGAAYQVAKRLTTMHPNNPAAWLNLGKCADTLWRMDEAEAAYRRALNQVKAGDDETKGLIFNNLAAMYLQLGEFDKARSASEKALKIDPNHLKARHNMGLCHLAAGEWKEGWKLYEASIGSPHRIAWNYTGEPAWKGEPDGTVVIFGEQGIGDEVCAASMIPDAIKRAGKVIIDCDARLANLFQRSFPDARIYGTRSAKVLNWAEEDQKVDYSIPAMQVGALFREKAEDFPGTPYLKADPDRVLMWKALWASKGKPAIGIAWTGGIKETAAMYRRWNHDEMAQIMRTVPAKWVSLQYKDASAEITEFKAKYPDIDLVQYPATLARDYDETAALFASLDAVVAMQSTAVHVAGALGVPCVAGIPKTSQWRYGSTGDSLPWYSCVKLVRQKRLGHWELEGIQQWLRQSRFS